MSASSSRAMPRTKATCSTAVFYLRNKANKPLLTEAQLRAQAHPHGAVTYTCVPKGNGYRLALDRDLNGVLDGDE